jgi:hypothetical protein
MNLKIKKVWLGHVSVRDYKLRKCISQKEDLAVECQGHTKTYPYRSLKTYLTSPHMTECISKFNGQKYILVDLPWDAYST